MDGKVIVIEGLDGSGKHTQGKMLEEYLSSKGHKVKKLSFPTYNTPTGKMLGQYLNGDFGEIKCVSPKSTFLLFALNRLESKSEIDELLRQGYILIMDRYVYSNQAYQSTRVDEADRDDFLKWGAFIEFDTLGLPRADKVFFLKLGQEEATKLVDKKGEREYTDKKKDIHESDDDLMKAVFDSYKRLENIEDNWITIDCHAESGVRNQEDISREIIRNLGISDVNK